MAHGDCGGETRNVLANELARRVRAARCYDEVSVGYMRCGPSIEDAAARITSEHIRLYPLFMSDGYYVRDAIPQRLGLHDGVDSFGHRVVIDDPLGINPQLPDMLLAAALQAAHVAGIPPEAATLLLVAHGSGNSPHSAAAALAIASEIASRQSFGGVETAFLEEAPLFAEAIAACPRPVVVLGLFAGGGLHADDDVRAAIRELNDPQVHLVEQLGGYARIIELIVAELCRCRGSRGQG